MKIVFAFIDEVGIGLSPDQPIFGVGALIIEDSFYLNRSIHNIFTGAVSFFQKHKTRFEFKFNTITSNNFRFYKEVVSVLKEDNTWSFIALLIEKDPSRWTSGNYWKTYLWSLDEIINKISADKITIVADYLAKPKLIKEDFSNIKKNKKVANILQLESQGSLLLQLTDVLLGSIHFNFRRKVLRLKKSKASKIKIANYVDDILEEAKKEGRVQVQKMTAIEWLHAVKHKSIKNE